MRHFCTYFDHGYLPKGLVMLTTLKRHCPDAFVHVLCLDDACHAIMKRLVLPDVRLYTLPELEAADSQLAACKQGRSTIEYYWTMTPCLPTYLYDLEPSLDSLTYLDADLFFMSDPRVLFDEVPGASVLLMPHRFPDNLREREAYGIYNVSWLTFANSSFGRACLAWYREKCLEWCYYKLEETRCGDQKYLDYFAENFSGVHALRHIGAGLAPWNVGQYRFSRRPNGTITADNAVVIFYHAHAFWNVCWRIYDTGVTPYAYPVDPVLWHDVLRPYGKALHTFSKRYGGDVKGLLRKGKDTEKTPPLRVLWNNIIDKQYLFV